MKNKIGSVEFDVMIGSTKGIMCNLYKGGGFYIPNIFSLYKLLVGQSIENPDSKLLMIMVYIIGDLMTRVSHDNAHVGISVTSVAMYGQHK